MTEYSKLSKGRFTAGSGAQAIYLPYQPDYVELFNYTNLLAAPANNKVLEAKWDSDMGQGFAVEQVYNGSAVLVGDAVTSNGISTFRQD